MVPGIFRVQMVLRVLMTNKFIRRHKFAEMSVDVDIITKTDCFIFYVLVHAVTHVTTISENILTNSLNKYWPVVMLVVTI